MSCLCGKDTNGSCYCTVPVMSLPNISNNEGTNNEWPNLVVGAPIYYHFDNMDNIDEDGQDRQIQKILTGYYLRNYKSQMTPIFFNFLNPRKKMANCFHKQFFRS